MNTMADGARDRLVAQIGEILFGQPGLTLMELAEKVKGMRAQQPVAIAAGISEFGVLECNLLPGGIDQLQSIGEGAFLYVAQPSPAGQGDALPPLPSMGYEVRGTGMGPHDVYYTPAAYTAEQMHAYARAALAARQPVAAAVKDSLTGGGGQEPNGKLVAWWNGIMPGYDGQGVPSIRWGADAENSGHDIPLYDGYNPVHYQQPAQAVDLGQFRELASEMDRFRTKWKTVSIAEFNHYADRLLALIDSKESATEPCNCHPETCCCDDSRRRFP